MKGRGSLLCTDKEGIYLLKEYTGSVHRLELLAEVLRALKAQGFLAEELVRTSGGDLCYTDADGVVVTGAEDPKHTITELKNAIISLGGNI